MDLDSDKCLLPSILKTPDWWFVLVLLCCEQCLFLQVTEVAYLDWALVNQPQWQSPRCCYWLGKAVCRNWRTLYDLSSVRFWMVNRLTTDSVRLVRVESRDHLDLVGAGWMSVQHWVVHPSSTVIFQQQDQLTCPYLLPRQLILSGCRQSWPYSWPCFLQEW